MERDMMAGLTTLRKTARERFGAIRIRWGATSAAIRARAAADDVWSELSELGFPGFLVPVEYAGSGAGLAAATVVIEELAAQGLHSFQPILLTMGTVSVARGGSPALKQELLPRLARGELKVAIGSTESEAGFNVLDIATLAERRGDHYVINGSKVYVSGADVADCMLLVTRTTSREECERRGLSKTVGLSLFIVDLPADGIEMTPLPSRGEGVLAQFALRLKDVRVAAGRLVGDENDGTRTMFHAFNPERTLGAAMALGVTRYCLDLACEHARTRKVFGGTPIGAYQSVQHPLAEVAIHEQAARFMTHRAARLFDEATDEREAAAAAGAAKYLASELAVQAVDAAIDTFGGKGFDEYYGIIHLWESARLLRTAPISNALILNQVAEHYLRLPRSY